jgi:hypothetical protein
MIHWNEIANAIMMETLFRKRRILNGHDPEPAFNGYLLRRLFVLQLQTLVHVGPEAARAVEVFVLAT